MTSKSDIASHVNILHNNINNRYPTQASPEQFGKLAERIERSRQMTGGPSTWDIYKKAADTPQPVPPPKKQRDPDLDLGLASLIGGSNEF